MRGAYDSLKKEIFQTQAILAEKKVSLELKVK
jgi:hypothetical protein